MDGTRQERTEFPHSEPLTESTSRLSTGTCRLFSFFDSTAFNEALHHNKAGVSAILASYVSTFAGYPLDSMKSRLQTTKGRITVPKLALMVYREEGIMGFYRGLWIPLLTISFVRATSFTIYSRTKEVFAERGILARHSALDAALTGGAGGAMSGALISCGSVPFELVRRQLEYSIAASRGIRLDKAPGTLQAINDIFHTRGVAGLYIGFPLHFLRDTTGTMLYFMEYDAMRHVLGRNRAGEQGTPPSWLPIPPSLIPFVCGSLAGVTSWSLIYPLDVVKTKVQQRALAGERYRGPIETFRRLVRGPDPNAPRTVIEGVTRIYRGLGVSAIRSITTHGLLWTFFDMVASYIDGLPRKTADNG
ncbi:mitochondrial carrier [Fistulina hepatica ATCC 64428]|nr:mitochondrial carrier [Fistulina hepatica ATCC 64428]